MNKRQSKKQELLLQNKIFAWIAFATAAVLSVPLVAMQFSNDVDWKLNDFIIIGFLLFGSGALYVYIARIVPRKYRIVIAAAFAITVLYIWGELAVGIFTNLGS